MPTFPIRVGLQAYELGSNIVSPPNWLVQGKTPPSIVQMKTEFNAGNPTKAIQTVATGCSDILWLKALMGGTNASKGEIGAKGSPIVKEGSKVYRVWGRNPATPDIEGAGPYGHSWTTVNPKTISNYRAGAGLFSKNTGRFVSEGILKNTTGVTSRQSLSGPLTTNTTNLLPEILIPNSAAQIELINVYGVTPPF